MPTYSSPESPTRFPEELSSWNNIGPRNELNSSLVRQHDVVGVQLQPFEETEVLLGGQVILGTEAGTSVALQHTTRKRPLARQQVGMRVHVLVMQQGSLAGGGFHHLARRAALVPPRAIVHFDDRVGIEDLALVVTEHRHPLPHG